MQIGFIQNLIDKKRGKEHIPYVSITSKKIAGADKFIKKVDTLILGSSHMEMGYIASRNEYNLATSSQDLYYGYELLKKYNNDSIKNIILGISYFSPWHVLIKTNEYAIYCTYFKILAGIDYQYEDVAKEKNLYEIEEKYKEYLKKYYNHYLPKDYRGNHDKYPKIYHAPTEDERNAILKAMKREHSQMYLYKNFLEDTKYKNIYVVIPPMSKDFQEFMPNKQTIFSETYEIVKSYQNVKLLDYYNDRDFDIKDFYDYQHLNLKGAKKLTSKIKSNL